MQISKNSIHEFLISLIEIFIKKKKNIIKLKIYLKKMHLTAKPLIMVKILLLILVLDLSICQILQSSRVTLYTPPVQKMEPLTSEPQIFRVPYLLGRSIVDTSAFKYNIVLSLSSFYEKRTINVGLLGIDNEGFVVQATGNVYAFSYLLVRISDSYNVGTATLYYPISTITPTQSLLVTTSTPVPSPSKLFSELATVQPFISQLCITQSRVAKGTQISLKYNWSTKQIQINRTADVTKISISYLMYVKVGELYPQFAKPCDLDMYRYEATNQTIFLGLKAVQLGKESEKAYLVWRKDLRAQSKNIVPSISIMTWSTAQCQDSKQFLSAMSSPLDMSICSSVCSQSLVQIFDVMVCIRNETLQNAAQRLNVEWDTVAYKSLGETLCNQVQESQYGLRCQSCNFTNHYFGIGGGECFCYPQFYASFPKAGVVKDDQVLNCLPCKDNICPLELTGYMDVINMQANSSQAIKAVIQFNKYWPTIRPYGQYSYRHISLQVLLNDKVMSPSYKWISDNSLQLSIVNPPYSATYNLQVSSLTKILLTNSLSNSSTTATYFNPSASITLTDCSNTLAERYIAESFKSLSNSIAITSLMEFILGAKLSLFSFMQVSSLLYLSSFIQWAGYGSNTRNMVIRMLFRMEPSSLLASLGINLPIPRLYTDDKFVTKHALQHYQNQMYISLVPQYLISALINIIIIEALVQISLRFLPPTEVAPTSSTSTKGTIVWQKPSTLSTWLEAPLTWKLKLSHLMHKACQKRLIFYISLFTSQICYHFFMISSQLFINVNKQEQTWNFIVSITALAICLIVIVFASRDPLILVKSIGVVYKKKEYTINKLFIIWLYGIAQLALYGITVSVFQHPLAQSLPLAILLLAKILLFRGYLKNIQQIKAVFLFLYFFILSIGTYFTTEAQKTLEICSVVLISVICLMEIFKIIRSIIVLVLGLFRGVPSARARLAVNQVKQYLKENEKKKEVANEQDD